MKHFEGKKQFRTSKVSEHFRLVDWIQERSKATSLKSEGKFVLPIVLGCDGSKIFPIDNEQLL